MERIFDLIVFRFWRMSHDYCDYLIDLLSPWGAVTAKRMFGCLGLYRGGQIFGLVLDDVLYLKVGDANRADFESAGSEPLCYKAKGKTVKLPYWQAPSEILDDAGTLCAWAEKSYQVALMVTKPKKKTKSLKKPAI